MSDFPPEVVAKILSRLPVKPLLRFKCVSKPWRSLIDSSHFIKLHLNHSVQTNSNHTVILRRSWGCLYSLDLDSLHNLIEINHPLKCDDISTEILGSCNGLLCLYNSEKDIALWNPSTRTHHKLPLPDIQFPNPDGFGCCQYIIYGFGYDHVNDDYKVVRMIQFYNLDDPDSFDSEVKVYSLKSNSWRRIGDFPYYLRYKRAYGMFANGALHWVVTRKPESDKRNLIAAFDLGTEEYRLVPLPDYSDTDFHMNVKELGGCLCVIGNFCLRYVDIWVMKEYGVKESWTKLISVAQPNGIRCSQVVLPIAYSKSGEQVLLEKDKKRLVWYDIKRKKVKTVWVARLLYFFESNVYVESLVKLPNGVGGTNGQADEKRKKDKKKNKQLPKKRDDFLSKGFKLASRVLACFKQLEKTIECIGS